MLRNLLAVAVATCAIVALSDSATAAPITIVGYDIPQASTPYGSIAPNAGGAAGVTATSMTKTGGLSGSVFSNHFYQFGWNQAVNPVKYYSTTFTVDPGKTLSLTDMTYSVEDTNHPSGQFSKFFVRTSLDGFVSNVDSFTLANNLGLVVDRTTILAGLGSITGSIEFRFYATTALSNVRMGFANHLPGGAGGGLTDVGQNIRFNGEVSNSAVPEPTSMALFGLTALGLAAVRRRRQSTVDQLVA